MLQIEIVIFKATTAAVAIAIVISPIHHRLLRIEQQGEFLHHLILQLTSQRNLIFRFHRKCAFTHMIYSQQHRGTIYTSNMAILNRTDGRVSNYMVYL
jgi:hypothetical protein